MLCRITRECFLRRTDKIRVLCQNERLYSQRQRRSGDGRKRDIFEEKSSAHQEEYFRKETARLLEDLRKRLEKRRNQRNSITNGAKTEQEDKKKTKKD